MTNPPMGSGHVCEHGIRWPWACDDCDAISIPPAVSEQMNSDDGVTALREALERVQNKVDERLAGCERGAAHEGVLVDEHIEFATVGSVALNDLRTILAALTPPASRGEPSGGEISDEVVGRMVRAICDAEWNGTQPWDRKSEGFKNRHRESARAALAAGGMTGQSPTAEMLAAGASMLDCDEPEATEYARGVWFAMDRLAGADPTQRSMQDQALVSSLPDTEGKTDPAPVPADSNLQKMQIAPAADDALARVEDVLDAQSNFGIESVTNMVGRVIANDLRRIFAELRARRAAASDAAPYKEALGKMREAVMDACELLMEKKHGNPTRSPGHNARLLLQSALAEAEELGRGG